MYAMVNTYDRYELILDPESLDITTALAHFIRPEFVVSLTIDHDCWTDALIYRLTSLFDRCRSDNKRSRVDQLRLPFSFHQFTRLRSLSLYEIPDADLEYLFENLNTTFLISLSIETSEGMFSIAWTLVPSVINRWNLQKLCVGNVPYTTDIVWPVSCTLKHLAVFSCSYSNYLDILDRLPHLQALVVRGYTAGDMDNTLISTTASIVRSSLKSLSIIASSLRIQDFELILLSVLSLRHLKLISKRQQFDSVFDASYWEQLTGSKLPNLDKLEFFFAYQYDTNDHFINLESLVAPFRAQFWVQTKRWFVTCAYAPESDEIWLYTTPTDIFDNEDVLRCEVSWMDNTCRLTQRPLDTMVDNTPDEVCD
ncbi:unnamed protein product [Rotaria sp. Silwood1]|nr:unnamed protein product [Rotaria sp. Silwood1]CAF1566840.1 unnamed protein product [Rotaria sp. Silwood1]CAF3589494.1 unnamed protein product [Rotaria sp. Silwood1]CAF3653121.1 unnamed protein product [Rotaria sp. Silwood1]CAF3655194.1 unnamed protein product [Rotaria sp. Silwood1]